MIQDTGASINVIGVMECDTDATTVENIHLYMIQDTGASINVIGVMECDTLMLRQLRISIST